MRSVFSAQFFYHTEEFNQNSVPVVLKSHPIPIYAFIPLPTNIPITVFISALLHSETCNLTVKFSKKKRSNNNYLR